ncbi:MAG: signal peptidase II [Deltaproteobacteria bacterium]|nr:MAG: signal peptidase II [Deltaproteobacteria bacterium]
MHDGQSRKVFGLFALVVLVILILDQATKAIIVGSLHLHEARPVIPGYFDIVHFRNTGAAFGFLGGKFSPLKHYFFTTVSMVALLGILFYLLRLKNPKTAEVLSLGLIFAGAAGNLIDRLRFGKVIDFLYFHWHQYYWPAFNVADSAITVGAILLMWTYLRK